MVASKLPPKQSYLTKDKQHRSKNINSPSPAINS